jgi:hypothetical protein
MSQVAPQLEADLELFARVMTFDNHAIFLQVALAFLLLYIIVLLGLVQKDSQANSPKGVGTSSACPLREEFVRNLS